MKGHLKAAKLLSDKLLQNTQYDETIFSHNSQDIVEVHVNTTPGPLLNLSNPATDRSGKMRKLSWRRKAEGSLFIT